MKIKMYSLFYFKRKRGKYDIICSEDIRTHTLFMLIALVGLDVNGLHAHIFYAVFNILFAWILLADILLLSVVHNVGVYKYLKKERMAQEGKGKATEKARGSDQKQKARDRKNPSR